MTRAFLLGASCYLCLLGCSSTPSQNQHTAATKEPLFVKGTYEEGSNLTEPRPRESEFLRTKHAGFVVVKNGAAYYLAAEVLKRPPSTFYLRVQYENPQDKTRPFVNEGEFRPEIDSLLLSSPDVVWGIRNYQDYKITVEIFQDREFQKPVDTLIQPVRAYVDTSEGKLRLFKDLTVK